MHEIITIQAGQCGNQVANEFWKLMCNNNNLSNTGQILSPSTEKINTFFLQNSTDTFTPRSILVDSEPRVIQSLMESPLYSSDSVVLSPTGTGAGNNWANGFNTGKLMECEIIDTLQHESEACDNMEAFNLIHSVAGGTGSGMGSYIIDVLKEFYPKKILCTFSVFPHSDEFSDTVVQPYNSILSLSRINKSDISIIVDNNALFKLSKEFGTSKFIGDSSLTNFDSGNFLLGSTLCEFFSPIRIPGSIFSNLSSISSILTLGPLKYTVPSLSIKARRILKCKESIRRLFMSKSQLATVSNGSIISVLNIFNGFDTREIQSCAQNFSDRNLLKHVPWMAPSFHNIAISSKCSDVLSGVSLCNTSGITQLLKKTTEDFDKLKKRNAFTDAYRRFDSELSEFDSSRECVQGIINEYEQAEDYKYSERE